MKEFWKDYGELLKDTGRFYKKHWKGCLVMNAALIGVELGVAYLNSRRLNKFISDLNEEEIEALN